jgi:hypothetical protein
MALGIFKKAWNTTQLEDLTNYFSLSSYLLKLNGNNTAIGSNSANINGRSGVIDYNQSIPPQSTVFFTFTNTSVDSNSVIMFSLKYSGGTGFPYIQNYSIAGNTVTFAIANSDLISTTGSVFVNFLIVN